MKCPGYFKFYDEGLLKNDDSANLLIEEKLEEFMLEEDDEMVQIDGNSATSSNKNDKSEGSKVNKFRNFALNTDHSVVIIGWGESKQNGPYWVVRNSFGKDWGMDGYLLVSRGKNDFGLEEEVAGFEVRRCDPENLHECSVMEPKISRKRAKKDKKI